MHANTVDNTAARQFDTAMQQAALFKLQMRHVLIMAVDDREAREDGIAVMTMVIDHVAAIRTIQPMLVGEKLMLRSTRPIGMISLMQQVQSLDFLQEENVRVQAAELLPQLMHHHAPVKLGEAFMDVERRDVQLQLFPLCVTESKLGVGF